MKSFPDISDNDYRKGLKSEDAKTISHIAYSIWKDRSKVKREILKKMYDHYGKRSENESQNIMKTHGKQSRTKYEKLSIGRTKIRRLLGEWLEMGFESNVYVTNKDAINAKMDKYIDAVTLSVLKPQIEMVRSMGIPAYKGAKIPSMGDDSSWDENSFKLDAEIVLQTLLNTAITEENIKLKFYSSLEKFLIGSEAHAKVERSPDGKDITRPINPLNAIFIEYDNDYFCERTPLKGEMRFMTRSEILQEFSDHDGIKEKMDKLQSGDESSNINSSVNVYNDETGYDVLFFQTKSFDLFYEKTVKDNKGIVKTFEISKEDYRKNSDQIKYDVKNGKYEIKKMYRPCVYEIAAIHGSDWILRCEKTDSTVLLEGKDGKYYPEYDYISIITPKVGGERVSLQSICSKIERVVDQAVYQIKKEMAKPAGSALGVNGGALFKGKTMADIIHDIAEDGLFQFESSGARNNSGDDIDPREIFVSSNLGTMDKLRYLIEVKTVMERTLDNITGINDAREGFEKATSTATTANQNISASRSATYEIFFLFGLFTKKVLTHLLNKMKTNPNLVNQQDESIFLSDMNIGMLKATKDLILYDYGAVITDGIRESNVMQKMERLFEFELNAGTLRAEDVAQFFNADSFGKSLKVINESRKEIEKIKEKEQKQEIEKLQTQERAKSQRELNKQANELDKIVLKGKSQQEVDDNKAQNEINVNDSDAKSKAISESENRLSDKNPDGLIEKLNDVNKQYSEIE